MESMKLSPQTEAFLDQQVAEGVFADRSQAIEAAIELLRRKSEILRKIDEGRSQIDRGESLTLDSAGITELFDQLKERARRRGSPVS